jgi:hypothetical protein
MSESCEGKAKALCRDVHRVAVEALRKIGSIAPSTANRDGGTL